MKNKIQALIVEDEENSRIVLSEVLSKYCPQVEILDYATDANEAVEKIKLLNPMLVFLDIELPYGNAFDIIKRLNEVNFHIVFTTAYDEYLLKAIKTGAADYLLKPIDYLELAEAIRKIEKKIEEKEKYINMELLLDSFLKNSQSNNMALPTMDGYSFIKLDDIVRIEAEGNYCKIFCLDKHTYTVTRQIHDIESKLPSTSFCRIHNSHIINLKHIKEYTKGRGGYVTMVDGSHVDVSNTRKEEFLERFS